MNRPLRARPRRPRPAADPFIIDVVACAAGEIGVEQTALLTASRIDGER